MKLITILAALIILSNCAGSPVRVNSMSAEELATQSSFTLCNAYNQGKKDNVRNELKKRNALSDSDWRLIDAESLGIGMSELALICTKGGVIPGYGSINVTTTPYGVNKQYVYEDAFGNRQYIYVENGKVTSWQL